MIGAVFGGDAEADDDGLRRVGQDDVALGDSADRFQEHADRDFLVLELFEFLGEGFDRALDVGLQDQVQALELLLGHLAVEVFQRDGLAVGVGEVAGADPPGLGDVAGARDVVDDAEVLAGARDDVQARDLDGRGRAGLFDRLALVVEECADAAETVAADDHIADAQRPVLNQNRGEHAAALGERGLEAGAGRRAGRVGLQLVQFGDRLERGQQVGDPQAGRRRGLDDLGIATPFDGIQPLLSRARRRSC